MTTVQQHMAKYRHARTSTLVQIQRENDKLDQLRQEIAAAKRVNEYRDSIGYVSWTKRAKDALSAFAKGWWAV